MKKEEWLEKEEAHWSNERTMLSHIRTGLTAVALGMGILNFLRVTTMTLYTGAVFMLIGLFFLLLGPIYFTKRRRDINRK